MNHFSDRLAAAVRAKGTALCVGLDPRWHSLATLPTSTAAPRLHEALPKCEVGP